MAACTAVASTEDMVAVPAGPFRMGSNDGEPDARPEHVVHLPAFSIDRRPVTNSQFAAFLNEAGARGGQGLRYYDDDDPDARIHRRGGRWVADPGFESHPAVEMSWHGARAYCTWRGARLPTEAEWEKAARGAHPGGASPYGMLDAAGNVWQWVSSAYRPYPWRPDDGREDAHADVVRGTRGGGHDSPASGITATERGRTLSRAPNAGHHNIGFRCAR